MTNESYTAPRSPAALRVAREIAALRRIIRAQTAVLAVVVVLQIVIAIVLRVSCMR